MKIRIDNLPWYASSEDLRKICVPYGDVSAATVMFDWNTHKSLGFGVVTMGEDDCHRAVKALDGSMYNLNTINAQIQEAL